MEVGVLGAERRGGPAHTHTDPERRGTDYRRADTTRGSWDQRSPSLCAQEPRGGPGPPWWTPTPTQTTPLRGGEGRRGVGRMWRTQGGRRLSPESKQRSSRGSPSPRVRDVGARGNMEDEKEREAGRGPGVRPQLRRATGLLAVPRWRAIRVHDAQPRQMFQVALVLSAGMVPL